MEKDIVREICKDLNWKEKTIVKLFRKTFVKIHHKIRINIFNKLID